MINVPICFYRNSLEFWSCTIFKPIVLISLKIKKGLSNLSRMMEVWLLEMLKASMQKTYRSFGDNGVISSNT